MYQFKNLHLEIYIEMSLILGFGDMGKTSVNTFCLLLFHLETYKISLMKAFE